MTGLHAHLESESRDCDGRYTSGYVVEMTTEEKHDSFGDLLFKERVLTNVVSLYGGTLVITPNGLSWNEVTEEGYRASEVRWCEEECDDVRTWQRDHTAERAGY